MERSFSDPEFDALARGVHALVFLDTEKLSDDFWSLGKVLPSKKCIVHFVQATPQAAEKFQFCVYPQVRLYKNGNEILSAKGTYDSVLEECLSCLRSF